MDALVEMGVETGHLEIIGHYGYGGKPRNPVWKAVG